MVVSVLNVRSGDGRGEQGMIEIALVLRCIIGA